MDVLEELEAAVAIWRLEHGDLRVVAVKADGGIRPLSEDCVAAQHRQPEVGEEGDGGLEIPDGNGDVFDLDRHTSTLLSRGAERVTGRTPWCTSPSVPCGRR